MLKIVVTVDTHQQIKSFINQTISIMLECLSSSAVSLLPC